MKLSDIKLRKYHVDYYKLSDENLHDEEIGRWNAWCSPEHFEAYLANVSGSIVMSKKDLPLDFYDLREIYSASDFNIDDEDDFYYLIRAWDNDVDELKERYDITIEAATDHENERKITFSTLSDFKKFLTEYTYHVDPHGHGMANDGSKGELVTFDSLKDKIDIDIGTGAVYTSQGFDGEDYFDELEQFVHYKCERAYNKFNFNENKIVIENALKDLKSQED